MSQSEASLTFLGAAKGVTGSCYLLRIRGCKILIDCGLFQGTEQDKNHLPFSCSLKDIHYLILTHAHLDHCGRIPCLTKDGFRGKIIGTKPTLQLAKIMLLDAAKVMREHYKTLYKKSKKKGLDLPPPPIYDELDVIESFEFFQIETAYDKPLTIPQEKIKITFREAGHILGSSFLEIEDLETNKKIIFSGDLGNKNKPIVNDYVYPQEDADFVLIETTYGDRDHKPFDETKEEFLKVLLETFKNGGNVLIPTFALERAQEILFVLREFYDQEFLPPCHIFLDSPLAIKATRIFLENPEYFDPETLDIFKKRDPFSLPNLYFTEDIEESKAINNIRSSAIIIAGNGTLSGGRILHHLRYNLWREECSLIFVGFQPKGTLGRRIIDGEKSIYLFGEELPVRASIHTINGFSSHAGQKELKDWLYRVADPERLFLVHGEEEKMLIFKDKITGKYSESKIHLPTLLEEIVLY